MSAVACSCSSRCVPFFRWQAQDAWLFGGMDKEDSYAVAAVVDSGSGLCRASFAGFSRAVFPLRCRQAQDAPHHGQCAPKGHLRSGRVLLVALHLALYSFLLSSGP